jgi:hypothetical protein
MHTKISISFSSPSERAFVAAESCLSGQRWTQGARNFARFGASRLGGRGCNGASKFSDHLISTAIWGIKSRKEPVTFHYKMRPPASFATFPTVLSCWRLFIQF